MNKCLYCGKEVKNKYCNVSCQNKHQGSQRSNDKYGEFKKFNVKCEKCGKDFQIEERSKKFPSKEKYYCSRSCANSKLHSEETKLKIKESINLYFKDNEKELKLYKFECLNCGELYEVRKRHSKFCSQSCSSIWYNLNTNRCVDGGRKSVVSQNRRSKNEIYFAELCEKDFKNIGLNEQMFNGWDADVILKDQKLAILWNGNWHHKKISLGHSLEQVQNRDRIKIKEILKLGYLPYIINDYGKYNKEFVEKEYEKLKIEVKWRGRAEVSS